MNRTVSVEFYQDPQRLWRWRFRAVNGKILADSGQGYFRKRDALAGAAIVTGTYVQWDELQLASTSARLVPVRVSS